MKTRKPKRVSPPPEDTRDKLLKAAIQVFSDHGYEGATVRAICRRAGVNLALVKYHYEMLLTKCSEANTSKTVKRVWRAGIGRWLGRGSARGFFFQMRDFTVTLASMLVTTSILKEI